MRDWVEVTAEGRTLYLDIWEIVAVQPTSTPKDGAPQSAVWTKGGLFAIDQPAHTLVEQIEALRRKARDNERTSEEMTDRAIWNAII